MAEGDMVRKFQGRTEVSLIVPAGMPEDVLVRAVRALQIGGTVRVNRVGVVSVMFTKSTLEDRWAAAAEMGLRVAELSTSDIRDAPITFTYDEWVGYTKWIDGALYLDLGFSGSLIKLGSQRLKQTAADLGLAQPSTSASVMYLWRLDQVSVEYHGQVWTEHGLNVSRLQVLLGDGQFIEAFKRLGGVASLRIALLQDFAKACLVVFPQP